MAARRLNWQVDLEYWSREQLGRPFVWGETDCHALVTRAYAVIYGACPLAPTWTTRREAVRLRDAGWVGEDGLRRLGARSLHGEVGYAQPGDVILEPTRPFDALLIAIGRNRFLTSWYARPVDYVISQQLATDATLWRFIDG